MADEAPRIVAFGGGTGLPMLLEGMRDEIGDRITAVVSVADDGGSSGRLRRELGIAPPGDVRNCLVALAGLACRWLDGEEAEDARDLYCLARVLERAGLAGRCEQEYERAERIKKQAGSTIVDDLK